MTAITLYQDPKAMECVRLYTDPCLSTFGKKTLSATAAGAHASIFNRKDVQQEIDKIIVTRMEQSEDVVTYLGAYTIDAAKELIGQLSAGRDLEFIPMEDIKGSMMKRVIVGKGEDQKEVSVESDGKLLASIVRHNAMVLQTYEARRKVAVEILRQRIGTPEQRIVVDKTGNEELPQLTDLPDDQLEELGSFISNALKERKQDSEGVEEADWSEENPTEEGTQAESSDRIQYPGSQE